MLVSVGDEIYINDGRFSIIRPVLSMVRRRGQAPGVVFTNKTLTKRWLKDTPFNVFN